jgi:hypothetical protein
VRPPSRSWGAPPVPKKLAAGSLLSVRFSEGERKALEQAADSAGLRLSEWARQVLLVAPRVTS